LTFGHSDNKSITLENPQTIKDSAEVLFSNVISYFSRHVHHDLVLFSIDYIFQILVFRVFFGFVDCQKAFFRFHAITRHKVKLSPLINNYLRVSFRLENFDFDY